MSRRTQRILLLAAIAAAAFGAAVITARAYLPSWLRTRIERAVLEATGRELRIAGAFELGLSLTPTLVAEDVTLTNASWGSEPQMLRAARAEASVHLASLWSPPLRIQRVEIDGVRILLESGADGRGNWVFDGPHQTKPQAPAQGAQASVILERVAIRDFEVTYRAPHEAPLVRFGVDRLDAKHESETEMISLGAAGHINDARWDLSGQVGPFDRLFELGDVEHSLDGHWGDAKFSLRGRIQELKALRGPEFELEIGGPDIAVSLAAFGLRSPLSGPFHLRGRAHPSAEGVDLDLTADVSGVTAAAQGHVRSILSPGAFDAHIHGSGPDASLVGQWIGVDGLPARPFELTGGVRHEDPWLSLNDVRVRVGGTSLVVNGAIGEPPRCVGTNLAVTGSGPELSELSRLTHLELPTGEFTVRGRFLRRADALAVEGVDIRVREAQVRGGGAIGEPPRLANLDLTIDATGPDLSWFSGIATIALPHEPFAARGRVARDGAAITLDDIEGRLGDNSIAVRGSIVPAPRFLGTQVHTRVAGPDLGAASKLAGFRGLPAASYDISGDVRIVPGGYQLDEVAARAGRISAKVAGHLGVRPTEDDTALDIRVRGPALSDLAHWGVRAGLPDEPFTVSGRLRIDDRVYSVEHVAAEVGADRATLDGVLGAPPDLSLLDVEVESSGPRFADMGRFFTGKDSALAPRLPAGPYTAAGRVRRTPGGFELDDAHVTVGETEIHVAGVVGEQAGLSGTDLRFEARSPDASLASILTGVKLPTGPVQIAGRLARVESGTHLDGVAASIGDVHAEVSGLLGDPPHLPGTDLNVRIAGPNLSAVLGPVLGISHSPPEPFEISARVEGDADQLTSKRFAARLGEDDLEGSVSVRLGDKPLVEADVRSSHLDIPGLIAGFTAASANAPPPVEPGKTASENYDLLIPDEAIDLDGLRSLDVQLRLTAADLVMPLLRLHDVTVEGALRDGALHVSRFEGAGVHGGRATASFSVEPAGGSYRLRAAGDLTAARLDFAEPTIAPEATPFLDAGYELEGVGSSLHDIAAHSIGRVLITLGAGRLPTNLAFLSSGFLQTLLDALNPLRRSTAYTDVECGVAAAAIENGKAVVAPIAARTDKLTIVGRGRIDFDNESIDLVWTTKPRSGVGITPGSIANPYIKLGGTLASPKIEAKPLTAAASTGAAVATAGMTLLFRGFYDRITAEKKVCINALEEARRQVK